EHHVAAGQVGLCGVAEAKLAQRADAAQAHEHVGNTRSGILARGDRAHVRLGMSREQAQQLDSGVARPADDPYLDHDALVGLRDSTTRPPSYDIGIKRVIATDAAPSPQKAEGRLAAALDHRNW